MFSEASLPQSGGAAAPSESRQSAGFNREAKLFVGQVPYEVDEAHLKRLFGVYGTVRDVHLLRKPTGEHKGAAFVTYSCTDEADTAIISLHNRFRMLTSAFLQVSYAKNSPNISVFGQKQAIEVHQHHPENPLPEILQHISSDARAGNMLDFSGGRGRRGPYTLPYNQQQQQQPMANAPPQQLTPAAMMFHDYFQPARGANANAPQRQYSAGGGQYEMPYEEQGGYPQFYPSQYQ
jgi:RNA recognition motif-containing protein